MKIKLEKKNIEKKKYQGYGKKKQITKKTKIARKKSFRLLSVKLLMHHER